MDQFYYESGYIDASYFVYTADAESVQTSQFTQTCDASVIAGGVAVFGSGDLPAFATLTCTISHINGADLFAFSEAALAAQAEVIRTTNVELSTQFSVAVSAVRGIYVSAQADSFVAMISAGNRTTGLEAASNAAFSLAVSINKFYPSYQWITNNTTVDYNTAYRVMPTNFGSSVSIRSAYSYSAFTLYPNDTASSNLLNPVNSDFTLEFHFKFPESGGFYPELSKTYNILTSNGINIKIVNQRLVAELINSTGSKTILTSTSLYDGTSGNMVHIAIQRSGSVFSLYMRNAYYTTGYRAATITNSSFGSLSNINNSINFNSYSFGNSFLLDEFRYSIGIARYSGTSYTIPNESFDWDSYTRAISHFDNSLAIEIGFAVGRAFLNSIADLSVNPEKNVIASANIQSQFTDSTSATRIKPLDANIQTEGFLVAAAGRIRPFVDIEVAEVSLQASVNVITDTAVAVDAEFTEVVDATRNIGPITIDANATIELVASNVVTTDTQLELTAFATTLVAYGLIRPEVADLHAAFTVQAQIDAGKIAFANFDVAATLSAEVSKTLGQQLIECPATTSLIANGVSIPSGGVNMPSQFVQSTEGTRVRYNQAAISADTATTADGDVIRHLSGNLSSYSNCEINALRIKQLASNFTAISTELAISVKIGDFLIDCAVDTTLTVDAAVKQSNSAILESTTNSTVSGDVTKPFAAELEVNAFELAVADSGLIGGADLTVTTELAVHADVITSASAAVSSTATLVCRLDAVREGIAIEMSFGTMAVSGERTRATESHPAVTTQLAVQTGLVEQLSANLLVEGFVLAIGKVINLEASETYVVPSDNNYWIVPQESRSYIVEHEDRTYTIEGI